MTCQVCKRGGEYIVVTKVGPLCPLCHAVHWIDMFLAIPAKELPVTVRAARPLASFTRPCIVQLVAALDAPEGR